MSKRFQNLDAIKSEDYLTRFEVYKLGHSAMDEAHRNLIRDTELICRLVTKQDMLGVVEAMRELEVSLSEHFRNEEKLMDEEHYPFSEWHKTIHAAIEKDFKSALGSYIAASNKFAAEFAFASALEAYIFKHIDEQDRQFVEFLDKKPTTSKDTTI